MPKQEVGSTKWLGNKMKAKGLQKLRWYCQMCQKQCRDENGFKCHRMSDGHQRQMQCFVQDPNRFMDDFSQEFETGFMQLMSHSYRSTRVLANTVYADFISNRHHTHMNSTIWVTLSNFVQYLGRTNQCKIDKTPKGWYLVWVDNSPEAKLRESLKQDTDKAEMSEQQLHARLLSQQVEAGKADGGFVESEFTECLRQEGDAPIAFNMASSSTANAAPGAGGSASSSAGTTARGALANAFEAHGGVEDDDPSGSTAKASGSKDTKERKISAMEKVMREHEAKKRKLEEKPPSSPSSDAAEPWVAAGLVVKVMHADLGDGKFYRKKGRIEKVQDDKYSADIRMVESKALIRLEQEMLETVIPNVGKAVLVVKGAFKGRRATMRGVNIQNFCVAVELDDGTQMDGMGYDEVCKFED